MNDDGKREPGMRGLSAASALLWLDGWFTPWREAAAKVAALVRLEDWRASKLTFYFAGMAYAGLLHEAPGAALLGQMVALTVVLCLFAAFGHLVNDYSDIEADRAAGKKRLIAEFSRTTAVGGILALAFAILAIAFVCFNAGAFALVVLSVAIGTAYSLPPPRLKEKATLGWVCATLAQRTLPMAIIFQALDAWSVGAVGLTLLSSLTGVRYIIVHQIGDLRNDRRTGIKTMATEAGPERLRELIATRLFPLEIAVACVTIAAIAIDQPIVGFAGIGYAVWVRVAVRNGLPLRGDAYSTFVTFYYIILPLLLSALLVNEASIFLPMFVLAVVTVMHELTQITNRAIPLYVRSSTLMTGLTSGQKGSSAAPTPRGAEPAREKPPASAAPTPARAPDAPRRPANAATGPRDAETPVPPAPPPRSEVTIERGPPPAEPAPPAPATTQVHVEPETAAAGAIEKPAIEPAAAPIEPAAAPVAPASAARPQGKAASAAMQRVRAGGENRLLRYPHYARLRERAAIQRLAWPGLPPAYYMFRHAEALSVLKDPRFLKATPARRILAKDGSVLPVRGFGPDLVELDPPDHTRLRKLVTKAFTPRMVERLEPRIEALSHELLDRKLPTGEIELVNDYAMVIPITIITELLGLEVKNITSFTNFAYALNLGQTLGERNDPTLGPAKERFTAYLRATFEQRRREPRDDLISALVAAEQDGGRLSPDELIGMVFLLLLGGFVTTVNLIGSGAFALISNPSQIEVLRADPTLYSSAVDELLRYESPLELSSAHFASEDIEVGGIVVPNGAAIRAVLPATNRDPARFERPDELDVTREPCPHLSFGQGIHYCLGAPLARLEGRVSLRVLLERAPGLRLVEPEPRHLSHPILRALERLPLKV